MECGLPHQHERCDAYPGNGESTYWSLCVPECSGRDQDRNEYVVDQLGVVLFLVEDRSAEHLVSDGSTCSLLDVATVTPDSNPSSATGIGTRELAS